jgi:hypothetical protein
VKFYLGTHHPDWLNRPDVNVPLFVSRSQLVGRKTFPQALVDWSQDSSGFTRVQQEGRWDITPEEYVAESRRYVAAIGRPVDVWPQDWMCEPWVIFGTPDRPRTHPMWFHGTHEARGVHRGGPGDDLDTAVSTHQHFTVENGLRLRDLAPELPIRYVLQGWTVDHYVQCIRLYRDYGVDLAAEPVVGLGSVCRRQATGEIGHIISTIHREVPGIRLHGFGVKIEGLRAYGHMLHSADSQAWSAAARRRQIRMPGCTTHKNCANCAKWALVWREKVLVAAAGPHQMDLYAEPEEDAA